MKKFMMMALMAASATVAFAQNEVKEAKKLLEQNNYEAAIAAVQPALQAATAAEKAAAWNMVSEIHYQKYSKIQEQKLLIQAKQTGEKVDETAMYNALLDGFEAALKCDEFDNMPNEKGKVKPRFRQNNVQRYKNGRVQCINAGQHLYNAQDTKGAFRAFALYVDTENAPLFTGQDLTQDNQYLGEVAYFAGLAAYKNKDVQNVLKYSEIAAKDEQRAKDAMELLVFSKKESLKTRQDTVEYVALLRDASAKYPDDNRYTAWLGDYYLQSGSAAELATWADGEIAKHPDNKFAYVYKGEAFRQNDKFDEAVECYKKATELDPTYVAAYYQAGIVLNAKAAALNDQLADKNGMLKKEDADKINGIVREAKTYLEKVRELDPNREQVDWAYALYKIYYALKENDKAAEIEKILNN